MKDGEKFYAFEVLKRLAGRRVEFIRAVYPADPGDTGTLMEPFLDSSGKVLAAVRLDRDVPELGEYDNEIHWLEDVNLLDIQKDLDVLPLDT